MRDWISFLITGPESNLEHFCMDAPCEVFDRRKSTIRCRAHDLDGDNGLRAYQAAIDCAKTHDCTFQDLVDTGKREPLKQFDVNGAKVAVSNCVEEYPVIHLGTHGMKWPDNPCPPSSE